MLLFPDDVGCAGLVARDYREWGGHSAAEVLFRNVRVFDSKSPSLTAPAAVLVRGNVAAIGAGAVAAAAVTIADGKGRTLMPGLIDNHVHIVLSASSQAEMLDPKATSDVARGEGHRGSAADAAARVHVRARDMGGPRAQAPSRAIDKGKSCPARGSTRAAR
ncbi:MAG: hypothetical protein MZU91_12080 [Desulfosudis oleivorans]|nr:hypothetical protein [Desulfosudis oleivorans]